MSQLWADDSNRHTEAYWETKRGVWHIECKLDRSNDFILNKPLAFRRKVGKFFATDQPSQVHIRRLSKPATAVIVVVIVAVAAVGLSFLRQPAVSEVASQSKWISSGAIPYLDASKYIGQTKTIEGKIVRTYRYDPGNVIFLNFRDPYEGYFTVIIWRENWRNFLFAPEVFYKDKEVRVTGLIKNYGGTPQVEVTNPKQIEVAYMGFNYPKSASVFHILAIVERKTTAWSLLLQLPRIS